MSSTVIVLWRCRIFLSVLYLHFILFLFFLLASFQAASIMQGSNGLQPPLNAIKIEAPSYYCNSYTPPGPDHSASMLQAGAYSKSETILVLLKDVFSKRLRYGIRSAAVAPQLAESDRPARRQRPQTAETDELDGRRHGRRDGLVRRRQQRNVVQHHHPRRPRQRQQ